MSNKSLLNAPITPLTICTRSSMHWGLCKYTAKWQLTHQRNLLSRRCDWFVWRGWVTRVAVDNEAFISERAFTLRHQNLLHYRSLFWVNSVVSEVVWLKELEIFNARDFMFNFSVLFRIYLKIVSFCNWKLSWLYGKMFLNSLSTIWIAFSEPNFET